MQRTRLIDRTQSIHPSFRYVIASHWTRSTSKSIVEGDYTHRSTLEQHTGPATRGSVQVVVLVTERKRRIVSR